MPPQGPYGAPPSYTPAPQSYPPQTPAPNDPSRYEFLMGSGSKPQRQSLFSGGSFGMRIAVIVGGAVLLMIIVAIGLSFIPSSLNTKDLTTLAQAQNELLTVCSDATSNAKVQNNMNFAQNCMLSMMTSQKALFTYTAAHGLTFKPGSKALLPLNATTNATALKASVAASNYDDTFTGIASTELNAYATALKTAFASAKSTTQKQLLSSDYTGAQLLIQQLDGTSATTGS